MAVDWWLDRCVGVAVDRKSTIANVRCRWCAYPIHAVWAVRCASIDLALLCLPAILQIVVVVIVPCCPHLLDCGRSKALGNDRLDEANAL